MANALQEILDATVTVNAYKLPLVAMELYPRNFAFAKTVGCVLIVKRASSIIYPTLRPVALPQTLFRTLLVVVSALAMRIVETFKGNALTILANVIPIAFALIAKSTYGK